MPAEDDALRTRHDPPQDVLRDNRFVIWGPMAWGITREYEVYEDTLMSAAFDGFLATLVGRVRPHTRCASGYSRW
jgi:hypothetical protein